MATSPVNGHAGVVQRADPVDDRLYLRPGGHVPGWLAGVTDPAGGAGRDDVPWLQGDDDGDVGNQIYRIEREVTGGSLLHQLSINDGADVGSRLPFVGGDQHRPHRCGVLEGFALQPLPRPELVVT